MNDLTPQLLRSLKDYSKEKLVKDLISGVIVAIIALPLSIALALASGVAPAVQRLLTRQPPMSCALPWTACPLPPRTTRCSTSR